MKTEERRKARLLRAEGQSVKDIARALSVSTSSVSRWARDVELAPGQQGRLAAHDRGRRVEAGRRKSEGARRQRAARKWMNMLPYGTCRLALHSTRVVHHIYGAIQEYGAFDRPAWLD